MSKSTASRPAYPRSASSEDDFSPPPGEERQRERAKLRRQLAKGRHLARLRRPDEAIAAYREARRLAETIAQGGHDETRALTDLSRIDRLIGEEARRAGDVPSALQAFRDCHAALSRLLSATPDDIDRQHEMVRVRAALRDTLREAQDERLAIAAARMAAASADALAEAHAEEPGWLVEAMGQRLQLARLLRAADPQGALAAYCELVRSAKIVAARTQLEGLAWDLVKRAHLDLADLQQQVGMPQDGLATMAALRQLCAVRIEEAPELGGRMLDAALERYLSGLILSSIDDDRQALQAFDEGIHIFDRIATPDYLTAHVQQHRGRLFAHAEAAATRLGDGTRLTRLRVRLLDRLERIALDDPRDAALQHAVVAHSYDLARTLIDKQSPGLAADALTFAEEVLEAKATWLDDGLYLARWRAFLKVELGRAWLGLGDRASAQAAFADSLSINRELASNDPSDVRALCDGAYAEWQAGLLSREMRQGALTRARATLLLLDRTDRLPPYAKPWISRIEADLGRKV